MEEKSTFLIVHEHSENYGYNQMTNVRIRVHFYPLDELEDLHKGDRRPRQFAILVRFFSAKHAFVQTPPPLFSTGILRLSFLTADIETGANDTSLSSEHIWGFSQ